MTKGLTILRYVLLTALLGAVGYGVVREATSQAAPSAVPAIRGDRTIVYYMHATLRCATCSRVESTAQELLRSEFAGALQDGSLEWRQVDFQKNPAAAARYDVSINSIVVVRVEGGNEVQVRKLDEVMGLAAKPEELRNYIRQGIASVLQSGTPAPGTSTPTLWLASGSALLLGLLTAISPCPLAINVAAISFLARGVGSTRRVLLAGVLYTAGQAIVYVGLGVAILAVLQSSPGGSALGSISLFLQRYMNFVVAPVLVLVGMLLLGLLTSSRSLTLGSAGLQQRVRQGGTWWALALGVLFALSFCPISAGLFFGSLLALSGKTGSTILVPAFYGLGTALPVVAFALLMAFAAGHVGKAFGRVAQVEKYLRVIAGVLFLTVGLYLLTHVVGV